VLQNSTTGNVYHLTGTVIYSSLTSTVLLGVERDTKLEVAIKVLLKHKFDDEKEYRQAVEEVRLHSAVPPHANVIDLLAAEDTPTAVLLVTPYAPHGDLWQLVRYGQTYCESEVQNCASQIIAALKHIHSVCGLIHGDIKPHNLLLFQVDDKHVVQLCDFGFAARPENPDGQISFKCLRGTHGWFAPELLRGRSYGYQVDLFSSGLILFRMLAGYAPFDPPSNLRRPVEFEERYWCHVSDPCIDLVDQLLCFDPAERGTAVELHDHPWFAGPPPEPTSEQMSSLMKSGPAPRTDVKFWPANQMPENRRQRSNPKPFSMSVG